MGGTELPTPPNNAQKLIEEIFKSWKAENYPNVNDGTAFEVFAADLALRNYGLLLEDAQEGIVGGGQDGGVDGVFTFFDNALIDDDSEVVAETSKATDFPRDRPLELWIVQSKKSRSFEESALDKIESTLKRLLNLATPLDDWVTMYNPTLLSRMDLFRIAWEKTLVRQPKVSANVIYASLGDASSINPQLALKVHSLRRTIADSVPNYHSINVELCGSKELLDRYNTMPSYTLPLNYKETVTSDSSHVALVTLRDYFNLISDEDSRLRRHLFEWNVRDYEGNVSVNKEIRQTLQEEDGPAFWWLNNGVTIICSSATSNGKTYSLTDIQIVNGLQTSHEVYEAMVDNLDSAVADQTLLVRIIVTQDAATRDKVIRATNRQTSVTDASLRATHDVQRRIEEFFLSKGWYYDRRKNLYKNQGREASKIIGIPLLGAALTAMGCARPDRARGKPNSLLKNDDDYGRVFNENVDLDIYFWAAKTQRKINAFVISDDAEADISQRSNLKYHLAMLLATKMHQGAVREPSQLRKLASEDQSCSIDEMVEAFDLLKSWADEYCASENVILERATKSQKFSDFLLSQAKELREQIGKGEPF